MIIIYSQVVCNLNVDDHKHTNIQEILNIKMSHIEHVVYRGNRHALYRNFKSCDFRRSQPLSVEFSEFFRIQTLRKSRSWQDD